MAKKGLVGDLYSMPLPDVFQWVAIANKSGELFIQFENEDASVIFKNGKIVYASSNNPVFLLGQVLLRYRLITKKQLVAALGFQKKSRKPLGQVLVTNNILNKNQLNKVLAYQIEEVVYYLLNWNSGYFNFEEKEINVNTATSIPVDGIIMEGMRRKDELGNIFKFVSQDSVIEVVEDGSDVIMAVDSKKNLREIADAAGFDSFNTYKAIYDGLRKGTYKIIGQKKIEDEADPVLGFLIALELFNKNKIYESYRKILGIISSGYRGEQIVKFFENLKIYVIRMFYNKFGGDNSCFALNKIKLLDEKVYITPTEGFILSRIEEYPCINQLQKVVNLEKSEIYLVMDKLYKIGLLLLKEREENKTELLVLNSLSAILNVYKRELTGEMEIITPTISAKLNFNSGRLVFIHGTTEKFTLKEYLTTNKSFNFVQKSQTNDIGQIFQSVLGESGLLPTDLYSVIEVYETLVFYEILKNKPISIIFLHGKTFPFEIKCSLNLLYMCAFSLFNNNVFFENELDFSKDYELISSKENLLKDFGDLNGIKLLLEEFENNILPFRKLKSLDKNFLGLLNILNYLGLLREISPKDNDAGELESFLQKIKDKEPLSIFGMNDLSEVDIEEVKKKYMKFSKKFHPDLYQDEELKKYANEIFEMIKYAYDTIIDYRPAENSGEFRFDAKKIFVAEQFLSGGKVYMNMGRLKDAVDSFKKAYDNFSDDDEIKAYYGFALIRSGEHEKGFNILKNIKFTVFNDPELYFAFIDAALRFNKKKEANKLLDEMFTKYPEYMRKISAYQQKIKSLR